MNLHAFKTMTKCSKVISTAGLLLTVLFGVAAAVTGSLLFAALAGAALGLTALVIVLVVNDAKSRSLTPQSPSQSQSRNVPQSENDDSTPERPEELFQLMISQDRAALLLRPQVAENLSDEQIEQARHAVEESMAFVPDGTVKLKQFSDTEVSEETYPGVRVDIEAVYLDRYPVTNAQFFQFVQAGGYDELALWDREMLMGIFEFVDQTGIQAPKYWCDGKPLPGTDDHPVVGISWYEANAYARWAGKRLPTDAEWVKAASWPMTLPGREPVQRKYPWGNDWQASHANIWGTGPGKITPVTDYEKGCSVSGAYGLIGNVWEWTADFFGAWHGPGHTDLLATGMKSLRGGAFDTYFEKQANCHFQSGDMPLERKHNVGFRCAVGVCDLVSSQQPAIDETAVESQSTELLAEATL